MFNSGPSFSIYSTGRTLLRLPTTLLLLTRAASPYRVRGSSHRHRRPPARFRLRSKLSGRSSARCVLLTPLGSGVFVVSGVYRQASRAFAEDSRAARDAWPAFDPSHGCGSKTRIAASSLSLAGAATKYRFSSGDQNDVPAPGAVGTFAIKS